jgi:exopolysaccharide production protein ExoZ
LVLNLRVRQEIKGIQYLRGIAAMSVVIYHLSMQLHWMGASNVTLSTLAAGVDLFFVISGFIMVYSTGGGAIVSPFEFLERRLIRIVPLYWLATALAVVVLLPAPQLARQTILAFPHVLASFAFLPALHPSAPTIYAPLVYVGWTLNYEMLFYALFAAGIAFGGQSPRRVVAIASLPILILSVIGLVFLPHGLLGFYANPIMLEFVFGMCLALVLVNVPKSKVYTWLCMAALIALYTFPAATDYDRPFRYGLIASVIVGASIIAVWRPIRPLELLGDASYSIYLSHFFVLSGFAQLWRHTLGNPSSLMSLASFYVIGAVCAAFAGILCWRLVEKPITGWLKTSRRAVNGPAIDRDPALRKQT